jgi:hypothetical protein
MQSWHGRHGSRNRYQTDLTATNGLPTSDPKRSELSRHQHALLVVSRNETKRKKFLTMPGDEVCLQLPGRNVKFADAATLARAGIAGSQRFPLPKNTTDCPLSVTLLSQKLSLDAAATERNR